MWPELAGSKEDVTGLGAALGGYGRLSSLGLTGQESSVSEREWEWPCGGWAEGGRSKALPTRCRHSHFTLSIQPGRLVTARVCCWW